MRGPSRSPFLITVVVVTLWIVAAAIPGKAGGVPATRRVDVSSSEAEPSQSAYAFLGRAVSGNGRFVAFCSADPGLVPNDTNGVQDVFIRDRLNGTTKRVSVKSNEGQANGNSCVAAITPDGRFVAFHSMATNLVGGDTNGAQDVFIRDRASGTTRRVSLRSNGNEGNAASVDADLSTDGRYVTFTSNASNLVGADTNGVPDVFVRDRVAGTTRRLSVRTNGTQANAGSQNASVSGNGRSVTFQSSATNLVSGDTNGVQDIFVRDRATGSTRRVSVSSAEAQGNGESGFPQISTDGRVVAFASSATNLVGADGNGASDVFVRILEKGTTKLVSFSSAEVHANSFSVDPAISKTGRYVAFGSSATNLVGNDTNGFDDMFVRDRKAGTTRRVSVSTGGSEANANSYEASISDDGRFVVYNSHASNLVADDTNGVDDVFIRGPLL